jgi:hypothetical protein
MIREQNVPEQQAAVLLERQEQNFCNMTKTNNVHLEFNVRSLPYKLLSSIGKHPGLQLLAFQTINLIRIWITIPIPDLQTKQYQDPIQIRKSA